MPDIELPTVESFTIPSLDWIVTDLRNLDAIGKFETMDRWTQAAIAYTATIQIDHKEVLCEYAIPKQNEALSKREAEAFVANPDRDWAKYRREHPVERLRFQTGIENRGAMLSVVYRDRIIGAIHTAVYVVESDTREKITARSMLWVCVEPRRGMSDIDTNVDAVAFMIDNDLRLEDGRVLDFVGFDQVLDIPMSEWGTERAPMAEFYARLAMRFDQSTDSETGDIRFRRRGASPMPVASR